MILFCDNHGDLEVLKEILKLEGGEKVCLGDLVAYGPKSRECVELAKEYKDVTFLKGNWEAIITGETVSNRQFVTLNTCENLVRTLLDFYPKDGILQFVNQNSHFEILHPFIDEPNKIHKIKAKIFIKDFYFNRLEFLPFRLRPYFPNNSLISWLDSLELSYKLSVDAIATHGGLSNNYDLFTSTYHEFTATYEKAQKQIELAKKYYNVGKIFHAHTHFPTIIVGNNYYSNKKVKWDYDYPLNEIPYASLPATGNFIRTKGIFQTGYIKIEKEENSLKFIKL